jgi:hypothetical protein
MAVVRLATTAPGEDVQALLTRLDALERRLAGSGDSGPRGPQAPQAAGGGAQRGAAERSPSSSRSPQQATPAPTPTPPPVASSTAAPVPPLDPPLLDRLRALAAERDRALGAALEGVTVADRSETSLVLRTTQPFVAHRLERRRTDLEAVCTRLFGRPMRIEIAGPDGGARSDADVADEEAIRRRRRDALAHPAVNTALEILGGEVLEIRTLGDGGAPR